MGRQAHRHPNAEDALADAKRAIDSGEDIDPVEFGAKHQMAEVTARRFIAEARNGHGETRSVDAIPLDAEPLPATEEEFESWVRREVSGPAARARRIMALIDIAENGIGVARLNAIKQLDEISAQYASYEGRAESIALRVVDAPLALPAPEGSDDH